MQNEPDYAAAREDFECDMIFVLIARGLTDRKHLDAIKRALLIAEKLMSEPSEWLKDSFSAYCFKGFRAKLIEEIDHDNG